MAENQTAMSKDGSYRNAAQRARDHRTITINFEGLGSVTLPPTEELAFLGGIGALAAVGILEWPLAGVLIAGHLLARSSRNGALKAFGEALEEA
jgi:hypothetical protein